MNGKESAFKLIDGGVSLLHKIFKDFFYLVEGYYVLAHVAISCDRLYQLDLLVIQLLLQVLQSLYDLLCLLNELYIVVGGLQFKDPLR